MKRTLQPGLEQFTGMGIDGMMIGNKNIEVVEVIETPTGERIEGVDMLRSVAMILFVFVEVKEV